MARRSKIIQSALIALLIFALLTPQAAAGAAVSEYFDMRDESHWSFAALAAAAEGGLLSVYEDGSIRPTAKITRAEAASAMIRAFGATELSHVLYRDVSPEDWYYDEVARASRMEIFEGTSAGTFEALKYISREQLFSVIARALHLRGGTAGDLAAFIDSGEVSAWAVPHLAAMFKAGYINGSNGRLNPREDITREEFAQVMHNVVGEYITAPGTYTKINTDRGVLIRCAGVTLKDVAVSGDLIIGDGAGSGGVVLDNVILSSRLVIRGGANSLRLMGAGGEVVVSRTEAELRICANGTEARIPLSGGGRYDLILEGEPDYICVETEGGTLVVGGFSGSAVIGARAGGLRMSGAG